MKKLRTLKMSVMRGCVGFFLASAIGLVTPIAASSTSQPRGGSGGAAAFSCYSCSSQSALCGAGRVYDGQYLSRAPCTTACFLRTEPDGGTYRGCFDGWLGGLVDHKYDGCRQQHYLGHDVEWCFCRPGPAGSGEQEEEACNAGSREDVHKYAYTRPQSPQVSSNAVARQGPADALDYNAPNTPGGHFELLDFVTSAPDGGARMSCTSRPDGVYEDPADCRRYYHCNSGATYHMWCSPGTAWNQVLYGCANVIGASEPCPDAASSPLDLAQLGWERTSLEHSAFSEDEPPPDGTSERRTFVVEEEINHSAELDAAFDKDGDDVEGERLNNLAHGEQEKFMYSPRILFEEEDDVLNPPPYQQQQQPNSHELSRSRINQIPDAREQNPRIIPVTRNSDDLSRMNQIPTKQQMMIPLPQYPPTARVDPPRWSVWYGPAGDDRMRRLRRERALAAWRKHRLHQLMRAYVTRQQAHDLAHAHE